MDQPVLTDHTPTPAARSRKLPSWAIILIVLVILCCLCVGAAGLVLAFLDPIQQELGIAACLRLPLVG